MAARGISCRRAWSPASLRNCSPPTVRLGAAVPAPWSRSRSRPAYQSRRPRASVAPPPCHQHAPRRRISSSDRRPWSPGGAPRRPARETHTVPQRGPAEHRPLDSTEGTRGKGAGSEPDGGRRRRRRRPNPSARGGKGEKVS